MTETTGTGAAVLRAAVGEEPLDVARARGARGPGRRGRGGHVRRRRARPRRRPCVRGLEYSAHPTAGKVVAEVAADVAARATGVRAIAVSHRIGPLAIGDVALACAVAADHRREAFATCAELVDEVKRLLPVWKHQVFADGTDEWVDSA